MNASAQFSAAATAFTCAADCLADTLENGGRTDALRALKAVRWSADEAPAQGFVLVELAVGMLWGIPARAPTGRPSTSPLDAERSLCEMAEQDFRDHADAHSLGRFGLESAVRCLHASGDLLAQLTRTCVTTCLREGRCGLVKMTDVKSKRCPACEVRTRRQLGTLLHALQDYLDSDDYVYCECVTNRMKHRSMMGSTSTVSIDPASGERSDAFSFLSFAYSGRLGERQWPETERREVESKATRLLGMAENIVDEIRAVL